MAARYPGQKELKLETYDMKQYPLGCCLVICNMDAVKNDAINLQQVFQLIGFNTFVYENQSADQMKGILQHVMEHEIHSDDSAFVFCFLGHGNWNKIQGYVRNTASSSTPSVSQPMPTATTLPDTTGTGIAARTRTRTGTGNGNGTGARTRTETGTGSGSGTRIGTGTGAVTGSGARTETGNGTFNGVGSRSRAAEPILLDTYDDVIYQFNSCDKLRKKPKIMIFYCCQTRGDEKYETPERSETRNFNDVLAVFTAPPGFASYPNSPVIQKICDYLKDYHKQHQVEKILKSVQQELKDEKPNEKSFLVISSLSKKLLFKSDHTIELFVIPIRVENLKKEQIEEIKTLMFEEINKLSKVENSKLVVADIKTILGKILQGNKQFEESGNLFEEARTLRKEYFGTEAHDEVKLSVLDIAENKHKEGLSKEEVLQYKRAEQLYYSAYGVCQNYLGENHKKTLKYLEKLIKMRRINGNYHRALLDAKTLKRKRKECFPENKKKLVAAYILKVDHLNSDWTCVLMLNIGIVHQSLGRFNEAEKMYREALRIQKLNFGSDHPGLAMTYNNLGVALQSLGQCNEAEKMFREALRINGLNFGSDHPDLVMSYKTCGKIQQSLRQFNEAEKMYREALQIQKLNFGSDHPDLAETYNNLGAVYQSLRQFNEAEKMFQEALRIYRLNFGLDYPDLAMTYINLGALRGSLGQFNEAEKMFREALRIDVLNFGSDHPDLAKTYYNLGNVNESLGQFNETEKMYHEALRIYRLNFGSDHPDLIRARRSVYMVQFVRWCRNPKVWIVYVLTFGIYLAYILR